VYDVVAALSCGSRVHHAEYTPANDDETLHRYVPFSPAIENCPYQVNRAMALPVGDSPSWPGYAPG